MNYRWFRIFNRFLVIHIKERDRESMLCDLEEIYRDINERDGSRKADAWFVKQVLQSIPGFLRNRVHWVGVYLKNYFIIACRHALRNRALTIINICGLALGMAASFIILLYVCFETSFDAFHANHDNIYRIQYNVYQNGKLRTASATSIPAIGPALKARFPEVVECVRASRAFLENSALSTDDETAFRENRILQVTPSFLTTFSFPLIEGNPQTALSEPFQAVITRSAAQKYFGDVNPLGKTLRWSGLYGQADFEITGICENPPPNTHLSFDILFSYKTLGGIAWIDNARDRIENDWDWTYFYTYVTIKPGTDPTLLQERMNAWVSEERKDQWENTGIRQEFRLQPVASIHLNSHFIEELDPDGGSAIVVRVLILIAAIILLLAWFNYINISTSRALERSREVGIRKTAGAQRLELVKQFLFEYLAITALSAFTASLLVISVIPYFNRLTGADLSLRYFVASPLVIPAVGIFLLGMLLTGIHPALLLSSFNVIAVLKGRLIRSIRSIRFRKALILIQLMLSIAVTGATLVILRQMTFVLKTDLGFRGEQVLTIRGPGSIDSDYDRNIEGFRNALIAHPDILGFTAASNMPGEEIYIMNYIRRSDGVGEVLRAGWVVSDYEYIPTLEIPLVAGRNFSRSFSTDMDAIIINEAAMRGLGYTNPAEIVGKTLLCRGAVLTVIGIVRDYHQLSLKTSTTPLTFTLSERRREFYAVRIRPENTARTMETIETLWKEHFPGNPFDYVFLNDYFNQQYNNDRMFSKVFVIFSALIIIVACLGLFALASLNAVQRTKEIGIRKAVGASRGAIIRMLMTEFLWMILIAGIIAVPMILFQINRWLVQFAYRISIVGWEFIAAALFVTTIVMMTIGYQTAKAAAANPVESLRYE